jgi:hypothetical protein
MEAEFFRDGNYIYECKTSPSKMGEYFSNAYLKRSIKSLRNRWENEGKPSGYRYVFPVNYLDEEGKAALEELAEDYPDVDIQYFECDEVERLILNLEKVNNLPDLVNYLKKVREE